MFGLSLKLNAAHLEGDSFLEILSEEAVLLVGQGLHLLAGKKHGDVYVHFLSVLMVLVVVGLVRLGGVLGWGEGR